MRRTLSPLRYTKVMTPTLTRRRAAAQALPLIASNAALPIAGVVDTAVIGATGDAAAVAGIALGALIFNIVHMTVYFLRMSSTALAAQAHGAGDVEESTRILMRAASVATAFALALLILQWPVTELAKAVLQGEAAAENAGQGYVLARVWGAPAAFVALAMTGWLIGRGRTGAVMASIVVFSLVNIVLDVVFVVGFNWGVGGVGAATAIADWAGAFVAAVFCWRQISADRAWTALGDRKAFLAPAAWRTVFGVSRDLLIRTWALALGFAWFINTAAGFSTPVLGGTHVLMQFVTLWAFVLDAFAFTAEARVGQAVGARDRKGFDRAVRITTELSLASGLALTAVTIALGPIAIQSIVKDHDIQQVALTFLPYCAVIPLLGAPAWQLDGVFVGAARGPTMRNAMVAAVVGYMVLDQIVTPAWEIHGMWLAFLAFYVLRAGALAIAYPRLAASVGR